MDTYSPHRSRRTVAMVALLLAAFAVVFLGTPAGAAPATYTFNFTSTDPADGDGTGTCYSADVMWTDDCGGAGAPPVAPGVIEFGAINQDGQVMTQTADSHWGLALTAAPDSAAGPWLQYTQRIVITNTDPGIVFKGVTVVDECWLEHFTITVTELGGTGVEQASEHICGERTFSLPGGFAFATVTIEPMHAIWFGAMNFVFEFTPTVPGAPTNAAATAGDGQVAVTFDPPASDGSAAITGYTVTSSPAGGVDQQAGTTGTSHTITGLTNGVEYTFTVTATNSVGTGEPSPASNAVVPQATTTTTVSGSSYEGTHPASVTLTATVAASSGTPTGSVTFLDGHTEIGSADLDGEGMASITVDDFTVGDHTISAAYHGNATTKGSTSGTLNYAVGKASSSIAFRQQTYYAPEGVPFTVEVVVTAGSGTPTGTVTFHGGDSVFATVALVNGRASYEDQGRASGVYTIEAEYSGNGTVNGSMAAQPATVSVYVVLEATPEPDVPTTPEPVEPPAPPTVEPDEEPTQEHGSLVVDVPAGATSIVVADASGFKVGDTIRIGAGTAKGEDAVIVAIEAGILPGASHEPLVAAAAMGIEHGPTWRLHLEAALQFSHVAGEQVVVLAAGLPSRPLQTPAAPADPSATPAPPSSGSGIAAGTTTYARLMVAAMIIISLSAPALIATAKRES